MSSALAQQGGVPTEWLTFLQQFGLATVLVIAFVYFVARTAWPYATRKIDELTKALSDSQNMFIATLNAQREAHLLASDKQNAIFERVMGAQRDDFFKLLNNTLGQFFNRMDAHDKQFALKLQQQTEAIEALTQQVKEMRGWDGKERRRSLE